MERVTRRMEGASEWSPLDKVDAHQSTDSLIHRFATPARSFEE